MAAPTGNKFWEVRSTHGRGKLFESPGLLWDAACEYFNYCVDNPLIEVDFKGKDADRVEIPKMRAFTLQGLCLYLDCNVGYLNDFEAAIKSRKGINEYDDDEDFSAVITRIRETIYNQKFIGAAAGFLNAHIILRDLGLSEKIQQEHSGDIKTSVPEIVVYNQAPPLASSEDEIEGNV